MEISVERSYFITVALVFSSISPFRYFVISPFRHFAISRFKHARLDVYKTWTPGPWTTPLDPVHGPPLWSRSMDHPCGHKFIRLLKLTKSL